MQREVRDEVSWQTYTDLTYRSSGKKATTRVLGQVRESLRSHVISRASVDIAEVVAENQKRDTERDRGFAAIKQKKAALQFWVPGTVQIMLWVGQSEGGRQARKTRQQSRMDKTKEKPEKGQRGKIRSRG